MKFCEDCKHYRISFGDWFFRLKEHGNCAITLGSGLNYGLVSRQAEMESCVIARRYYNPCGPDAKLFEPRKPVADLAPPPQTQKEQ